MLFNSFQFLIFFPVVTALFFMLPHRARWFLLLAASCYFYMAFVPYYILILAFTIIIDYFAGILIENTKEKGKRKFYLIMSIVANVGVLAVFKYYNFFNYNLTTSLEYFGTTNPVPYLDIVLPIGLSFHTFQAMSYTIEVYRDNAKAERHFGIYSLYVMFYPQLVAGPIERPQNILPQFHQKQFFDYPRIVAGLKMMLWGMFKKVVIADRLSLFVDQTYQNPEDASGLSLLLTTYFFAFQIYCDFSGYSDIALGAAKVMGFTLMENFRVPYISTSIKEFWSRWHISLSTWFRDYVYIPLGGNRVGDFKWYRNLFVVFVLSGFWHGANWTYIIWGALHGFYLVAGILVDKGMNSSRILGSERSKFWLNPLKLFLTFHLVVIAWVFFRAESLADANLIVSKIASGVSNISLEGLYSAAIELQGGKFLFAAALLVFFVFLDPFMDKLVKNRIGVKNRFARFLIFGFLLSSIILFGYFGDVQFIYFQF